jgi:hypothetical protein
MRCWPLILLPLFAGCGTWGNLNGADSQMFLAYEHDCNLKKPRYFGGVLLDSEAMRRRFHTGSSKDDDFQERVSDIVFFNTMNLLDMPLSLVLDLCTLREVNRKRKQWRVKEEFGLDFKHAP